MKLDEQTLRRDTFTLGEVITLWDGQAWHFPRPMVRWRHSYRNDIPDPEPYTSLGHDFDAASRAVREAGEATADPIGLVLGLAAAMLTANYDLTRDDLAGLLVYDPGDPSNASSWREIIRVALGEAPRTPARWRRLVLWLVAGPPTEWVDLADLNDFLAILVESGRAIPASQWVTAGSSFLAGTREVCDALEANARRQREAAEVAGRRAGSSA